MSIEKIIEIAALNNEANPNSIEIVFPERDGFNNFVLDTNIIDFEDKIKKKINFSYFQLKYQRLIMIYP